MQFPRLYWIITNSIIPKNSIWEYMSITVNYCQCTMCTRCKYSLAILRYHIQLLEYPISLLCTCTPQKPSHGAISGTKSGIMDPLVSKHGTFWIFGETLNFLDFQSLHTASAPERREEGLLSYVYCRYRWVYYFCIEGYMKVHTESKI